MKKSLFNKSAVALAAGLFAACAANAFVVGPAGGPAVNTVPAGTVLNINPGHLGHSLFVPYYSAQNGNRTYLTLNNTDMRNGKAVKVRFRGASNSDDVLDFTVFLSPGDAWTAVVYAATQSNPARLDVVEGDTSCTAPAIPAGGQEFLTFRLHPQLTPDLIASETREGYIEIFNMADIPPTAAPTAGQPFFDLYRSIEHVNGVPRNCAAVRSTTAAGVLAQPGSTGAAPLVAPRGIQAADIVDPARTYADAQAIGFEVPTTGLTSSWAIANLANSRSWSGNATAVEAQTAAFLPGYGNIVFHPQSATAVPLAEARRRTSDPLLRGGGTTNNDAVAPAGAVDPNPIVNNIAAANVAISPLAVDLPDMSTPYLNNSLALLANGEATRVQAQRLTEALATQSVANEILTLGSGRTDWSFTFPTRRYNVARAYTTGANEGVGTTRYTDFRYRDDATVIAAGRNYFTPVNVVSETINGRRHQLCVQGIEFAGGVKGGVEGIGAGTSGNRVSGVTANREESFLGAVSGDITFSPAPPTPAAPAFCGEAGVFSYNRTGSPTGVLQAGVANRNFDTGGRAFGWARYSTIGMSNTAAGASATQATIATGNGLGLPVVGFAFWTYETLSVALPHRKNN